MTTVARNRHSGRINGGRREPKRHESAAERHAANQATPVFLAHGQQDNVVVLPRAVATRDALTGLGYAVEWHEYPMRHEICRPQLDEIRRWLLARLGA